MTKRLPYIEPFKGKNGYYWRIVAANGEKLSTSQRYASKRSMMRTPNMLAKFFNVEIRVIDRLRKTL